MEFTINTEKDYLFQIWILAPVSVFIFLAIIFILIFLFQRNIDIKNLFYRGLSLWALFLSICAIIITNGRTILIGIIPIFLAFIWANFKEGNKIDNKNYAFKKPHLINLLLGLITIHILNTLSLHNPLTKELFISNGDYDYYSRASAFFKAYHTESLDFNFIEISKANLTPYHFGDIWTTVIGSLFGMHPSIAYRLFYQDIAGFFLLLGLLATFPSILFHKYSKIYIVLLCILALLTSAIDGFYPHMVALLKSDNWANNFLAMPKLSIIYPFILAVILLLRENKLLIGRCFIAMLCTLYLPVGPSIIMAFCIVISINWIRKLTTSKQMISCILLLLLFTLCILYFYQINKSGSSISNSHSFLEQIKTYLSSYSILTSINIIGKTSIQTIITTSPFLLLGILILSNLKRWLETGIQRILLFVLSVYFLGLIIWALFYPIVDSVQLWANVSIPIINIVSIIVLIKGFMGKGYMKTLSFVCIFILIIFNPKISTSSQNFSFTNIKKAKEIFASQKSTVPEVFFVYNITRNSNVFDCKPYLFTSPDFTLINPLTKYVFITSENIVIPEGRYTSYCKETISKTDWYNYSLKVDPKNKEAFYNCLKNFINSKNGNLLMCTKKDFTQLKNQFTVIQSYTSVNGAELLNIRIPQ